MFNDSILCIWLVSSLLLFTIFELNSSVIQRRENLSDDIFLKKGNLQRQVQVTNVECVINMGCLNTRPILILKVDSDSWFIKTAYVCAWQWYI